MLQKHPEQNIDFQLSVPKASSRHAGEFKKPAFASFEEVELRRHRAANADILSKALEMGMKIWPIEKLEKILHILLDGDDVHNTRNSTTMATTTKAPPPDLSKLIQNEQINGPSDRETVLAASEIVPFKGPFLMIRDMSERVKPIMYREWPTVADREDGEWPQFRSVSAGKCPFLDEHAHTRRELAKRKQAEEEVQRAKVLVNSKTSQPGKAAPTVEPTKMNPPAHATRSRQSTEASQQAKAIAPPPKPALQAQLPPSVESRQQGQESVLDSESVKHTGGHGPGFIRGEPMASGMQQSNITSAIRSQMISSTAAVPGAKAGMSKEVHELKRKVLERNTPALMSKGLEKLNARADNLMNTMSIQSHNTLSQARGIKVADSASAKMVPPPRIAKQKAQEKIAPKQSVNIREEGNTDEEDYVRQQLAIAEWRSKRDPKPGYCENCKEKFDDFEEVSLPTLCHSITNT